MTEQYTPPVLAPKLGEGEESGGYREWCELREQQAPEKYLLRNHSSLLFSIIVPVHNPLDHWLQECIDSVRGQFFADWELILADDASGQNTLDILKKNQELDSRIKISLQSKASGISATTNRAADLAKGNFLVFLDHDDLLDAYALSAFAQDLQKEPKTELLYSDEDRFDDDYQRLQPGFKPQFSLEKLLCTNYIHHPVVICRTLFAKIRGLNSQYDGSQDYDLLLRAIEETTKIRHIPDILYHMRIHSGSLSSGAEAKPEAHKKGIDAVKAYFKRQQLDVVIKPTVFAGYHNITYLFKKRPKTSILILVNPQSSIETTQLIWQQHIDDEILICNNISKTIPERLNDLAKKAQGDILVFADGQLRPKSNCIDELIAQCNHGDTGLVTGNISYSDGKLFSCGVILGIKGCAGQWHFSCDADDIGYGAWMLINHDVSAVPWQLMAVKKELFNQAGLFDCNYKKQGFDINLALKLSANINIKHKFSALSKATYPYPCPHQAESWQLQDFILLRNNWKRELAQTDPFFNPNLSILNNSITFMSVAEQWYKKFGTFTSYDYLTTKLLWKCFNEE
ncbi:MAG: glycosyltransferase [Methylococcaceae bacterium]